MVLCQRLAGVDIKKWPNATKNTLHILSVSLELIIAYSVVNIFYFFLRVARCTLPALLEESFACQPILRVDVWIMVQSVQENQAVSKQKGFVFCVEVCRILPLVLG